MLKLKSQATSLQISSDSLKEKLLNTANFGTILPSEAKNFQFSEDGIQFTLASMPEIRLKQKNASEFVCYEAAGGKMPFSISCQTANTSGTTCEAYFEFNGDFNPMMAMMAKKPLQKFIDTLATNLSRLEK